MAGKQRNSSRREQSLSRARIIEASIELLDIGGEGGLTFQTLSKRLATGPGAIYWHIDNKSDLMTAACDAIVAPVMAPPLMDATPEDVIRGVALGLFDAIDAHPWVGSALVHAVGRLPSARILERLGQQVRALGVSDDEQWATVSALLNYIFGVGGQNAANAQFARKHDLNRSTFLGEVSIAWLLLDPEEYPFTRSIAVQMRDHDDRVDFLAGIDLILKGIQATWHR